MGHEEAVLENSWPSYDEAAIRAEEREINDISVIDVATLKEIGRIEAGIHPDGIAYLAST